MTFGFGSSRRALPIGSQGTPNWRRLVSFLLIFSGIAAATPLAVLLITSGGIEQVLQQRLLCVCSGACILSLLLIQGAALLVGVQSRRARILLQKVTLRELERQLNNAESPLQKQWPGRQDGTSGAAAAETRENAEGFPQLGQQVLENISEAVIMVGADGVLTDINSAAAALLGYSREEAAGKLLHQLLADDPEANPEQRLDSCLLSGNWNLQGRQIEVRFARKDGSVFQAEVRLGECTQGPRKLFFVSWNDTAASELAEMLSRDRIQIAEMIAKDEPLDAVLANLAQMLERQLPGSRCVVMRRRGSRLSPVAAPNLPESFVGSLHDTPVGPYDTSCGAAAFEGKPVIVTDIASDPRWANRRDSALEHGLRASWSAPVFTGEGLLVGTVAIYKQETVGPDAAQLDLLKMASQLASMCMEQKEYTGQLAYRAHHDALTGLPNRFTFEDRLKRAISHARRHQRAIGILSIDLDRFKLVNDTLGHVVGDGVLREVARRIEACLRESDIVARWGGDEFIVGLLELADRQDAQRVASKLMEVLRPPVEVEGHKLSATVTIGISVYPDDGQDLRSLVKNADRAMYDAKQDGKNTFQFYAAKPRHAEYQQLELENQLGRALERGELLLHYQPQIDLRTGGLVGVEALLRWNHPQLGLLSPAEFLPIAEHNGVIVPIGAWTLRTACRQAREFERAGLGRLRVAVNISGGQFAHPDFLRLAASAVEEAGIQPDLLDLEINDSLVMRDMDQSVPRLTELRALGLRVALDDFGAGYSSLGNLQRLAIDSLKINQSFVRELGAGSQRPLLVESIVMLAQGLGIQATAGGVESQTQLDALLTTGCDSAQGYLFGKPLPAEELLPSILRLPQNGQPRSMAIVPPNGNAPGRGHNGHGPSPCAVPQPADARIFDLAIN